MKVIFCASEVMPFAKTGGLADVGGSLPLALKKVGVDISIVMPLYHSIDQKMFSLKPITKDVSIAKLEDVDVYFVKNDRFFGRKELYGESTGDYPDNLERFSYFCKKTLEFLKEINLKPDVVHCHDWQTSLISVYLKSVYARDPFYAGTKTILTIHNLAYQGVFESQQFSLLGLDQRFNSPDALEFYGKINLLKSGIVFSDRVTTVSPQYAKEIRKKEFGCGLEGVINYREDHVFGILNGIDVNVWNPESDELIAKEYSAHRPQGKLENKKALQQQCGLDVREDVPVFGFVGRLSVQKGLDLLSEALPEIVKMDVQLVFQGVGEKKYQDLLKSLQEKYPKKVSIHIKFDEKTAHQIYAGSDIFLIPSVYEPCGLSQMISFRYGTIPLVYKTGGLADTVMPFRVGSEKGDGFVFTRYEKDAVVSAFESAISAYKKQDVFKNLISKVMKYDFSWSTSAKEYERLYRQ
ncbi:MAG: glycogen synthase GlgA [Candidatus Omnitrophica bacterium]|nr:glycogen synthase GlgA [Candidatus Omnitrophota bacterium]